MRRASPSSTTGSTPGAAARTSSPRSSRVYPRADLFALVDFLPDDCARAAWPASARDVVPPAAARSPAGTSATSCRCCRARSSRSTFAPTTSCSRASHAVAKGVRTPQRPAPRLLLPHADALRVGPARPVPRGQRPRLAVPAAPIARRDARPAARLGSTDQRPGRRISSPTPSSSAHRIPRCYDRDATVIYPPVDVDFFTPRARRAPRRATTSPRRAGCRTSASIVIVAAFRDSARPRGSSSSATARRRTRVRAAAGSERRVRRRGAARAPARAPARSARVPVCRRGGLRHSPRRGAGLRHAGDRVRPRRRLETIRGLDDPAPTGVFFAEQTPAAIADAVRILIATRRRSGPMPAAHNALALLRGALPRGTSRRSSPRAAPNSARRGRSDEAEPLQGPRAAVRVAGSPARSPDGVRDRGVRASLLPGRLDACPSATSWR